MERLFYFFMPGCPTCEAMKPIVQRFRARHPEVQVLPVDITQVEWRAQRWMPQVTPTLVRLDRNRRYHVFEGRPDPDGGRLITEEDLELWLSANF